MKIHPQKIVVQMGSASLIALAFAAPASAKREISPYLEFNQVVSADLKNGGDVLTYSTVAAGIDATVSNRRSEAQIAYRYERRIGYGNDKIADADVHSGLVRGRYEVVPNFLNIEAGALAARTRTDNRGAAPGLLVGNVDNISQVYSVYAGPTLTHSIGDVNVGAAYRLGYTAVDSNGFTPNAGQHA